MMSSLQHSNLRAPNGTRSTLRILVAAGLLITRVVSAPAQRVSPSLEVGAATLRFADSIAASAASFSPGLTINWSRARLTALGTYTQLGSSGWSTQGSADLSLATPSVHTMSGELALSTAGSAHWDGTRAALSTALLRGHIDGSDAGLWAGGGVGNAWDNATDRMMAIGDAGAWAHAAGTTFGLTLSPTALGDTMRYTDSELSAHWRSAAVDATVAAGFRFGDRVTLAGTSARSWASASILTRVKPYAAIVVAAGSYPVDLAQGFPGGRYVTVNLRFSAPALVERGPSPLLIETAHRTAELPIAAFELSDMPNGGMRVLRVRAAGAHNVEISGDFSGWQPRTLSSSGSGWWVAALTLGNGTHQVVIRVDGGAWTVPPGLMPITDEFGGVAGIWIIQ
jgi:hypothetical protein